jgi:hypothetical protein
MKILEVYKSLKRKSVELIAKGSIDEYFDTLMQLSKLERQMKQMSLLN